MPRSKSKKNGANSAAPMTTSQMLGSLLKSARDIMRKDKGLNGDLDRLPLLTWIMFLKFLDDLEQQREQEAKLGGKKFRPAVDEPYRWPILDAAHIRAFEAGGEHTPSNGLLLRTDIHRL